MKEYKTPEQNRIYYEGFWNGLLIGSLGVLVMILIIIYFIYK